jgi:beta-lactamase superfamily II metal-dependent hydrolase
VVISHFHRDHYNRLADLIRSGIKIGKVAINLPAPGNERIESERSWGFDLEDVESLLAFLRTSGVPYFTPREGERLIECRLGDGLVASLDVVCLYDGIHTPVGVTETNDTSIIIRLSHGKTRALFAGDLNYSLGSWLASSSFDLAADVIKAPHHGTLSCAPPEFFDRVNPKAALVPSPTRLWLSVRSKLIRDYLDDHQIPAFVSGIDGDVTVSLTTQGFTLHSESEQPALAAGTN